MPTSPPAQPGSVSPTLSTAELQRHALNASPVAIFTSITTHEVVLAEGRLLEALDLTRDGDRAQFLHTLVSHQQIEQALAGESVTHLVSHSGRWLDTTLTPLHDSAGAIIGVTALTVDATDREAAEIRARAYANLVDEAASGAGIGTWEVDLTTNTGNWSSGDVTHLGLST